MAIVGMPVEPGAIDDSMWAVWGVAGLGVLSIAAYQWYLVATTGQTLGKRMLKIRIVKADGDPAGFLHGVVLRSWIMFLFGMVPYVGSCAGLVDALMIFSESRRCLHDRIAGTIVIAA